jgi:hypothetical protein
MMISAVDREMLEKLYERHKRTTFKGEADNCRDAILKILGRYGKGWDDLRAIIDPSILDLIEELLDRYSWTTQPREQTAIALWILHAHVYRQFNVTPRLAILSLEPESGKSVLLELIQHLVPRPMPARTIDTTPAGLLQSIDSRDSVLLLDEADNLGLKFKSNGRLRAILNGNREGDVTRQGNSPTKKGGPVGPKLVSTFIPVVISAIGTLPKALDTRCIHISMLPKPSDIVKQRINPRDEGFRAMIDATYDAIVRWASNVVLEQEPDLTGLNNRYADNWRPLIAIADALDRGEKVFGVAKAMTTKLHEHSESMQFRIDTRRIFKMMGVDRIRRELLQTELHKFDTWNDWGRPMSLTRNELSALIRIIGVKPAHTIQRKGSRKERGASEWGWYDTDFKEAWKNCPEENEDEDVELKALEDE